MQSLELTFTNKIEAKDTEMRDSLLPLQIAGVSCRCGYFKNKDFIILESELQNISVSLQKGMDGLGAYILKNHEKNIESAIGRVNDSKVNGNLVLFTGNITSDPETAQKIKNGVLQSSSVGLRVERVVCSICGKTYGSCSHLLGVEYDTMTMEASNVLEKPICAMIGKGITAVEQSIVLFPAIREATVASLSMSEELENIQKFKIKLDEKNRALNLARSELEKVSKEKKELEKKMYCKKKGIDYQPIFEKYSLDEIVELVKIAKQVKTFETQAQGKVPDDDSKYSHRDREKEMLKKQIFGE